MQLSLLFAALSSTYALADPSLGAGAAIGVAGTLGVGAIINNRRYRQSFYAPEIRRVQGLPPFPPPVFLK